MPRRSSELYLLPAMNGSGARVFKPPEGLSERPFDFAFNSIDFIASNPFLPLEFRVCNAPWLWRIWARSTLPFLQLEVPVVSCVIVVSHLGLCIGSTIAPEIIRSWRPRWSMVGVQLHHPITIWSWSVVICHWILAGSREIPEGGDGLLGGFVLVVEFLWSLTDKGRNKNSRNCGVL